MLGVLIPGLLCAGVAARAVVRGMRRVELFCRLPISCSLSGATSQMYADGYAGVGRVATGVVLAALTCVPYLRDSVRDPPAWVLAAGALWLTMLPVIAIYGFGNFRV